MSKLWQEWTIANDIKNILDTSKKVVFPKNREEILELAMGGKKDIFEVSYPIGNNRIVPEATVFKCKNGLAVNYKEKYMRRRDPDCMLIGDNQETDKTRFADVFNFPFEKTRAETFDWLKNQELILIAINIGGIRSIHKGLLIAPANAGFFVGALADLQGFINPEDIPVDFNPKAIVYLAPPFRHTHFNGKQIVVHNRINRLHEIFSYNLYPGPSAKKGIYGVLLQIGEEENWLTLHSSTVQVVTPYDNITTILHEGASGGGKSEMLEHAHREEDGRLLLGRNQISNKNFYLTLNQSCKLMPVTDDMALSIDSPSHENSKKLFVYDAEEGWFIRLNHITAYGTDLTLENLTIHPEKPLIFLNIAGVPNATALIWEHIEDSPDKPCPNPRVILPRHFIKDVVNTPVEVDFRSFGVRTPFCSEANPSYGIIGMFHILPPALAWLWRLVSPRGDSNPSITKGDGLTSEGVGSYWPFATGKFTKHANLLLKQIIDTSQTRHVLFANQNIGSWKVSFMPQWISREYLARRGVAKFHKEQLVPCRCQLLGYAPQQMRIEGTLVPEYFFQVEKQAEVGLVAYDKGVDLLSNFFKSELSNYLNEDLDILGKKIIECCLNNGSLEDYEKLIPMTL
ncbi:MAG: DUF4914 domain-containing protein [Candidatus Margulisiibacteriota bacterium]|nr:MAG: DUF4914 domain-containing protein [Candidatus Margulisbacteria bacterium GWD2_39_127]OGI05104.1 MAG: DUF4914 domain-containing protein [Candidatus Margulisbacteria bacterium GWF2_38_17]OGI09194.1 MAG: DUF4914 domain-containing protein [Candidatus Margulisbacteria bacterium GWE2_39_32]PZM81867.1 MAG: DUF4914 domain-containing protein [Candidatus Margulisiibacteriota bacterium]HAR63082.1 DUF4914 domain-containing protein [Candidatus Margulisiibacteriota bacterium]